MRSAMLPGGMSVKTPKPARSTVLGLNCHAIAVRGCHATRGVEGKNFSKPVCSTAFKGWLTSCEAASKDVSRRAIMPCGLMVSELKAARRPNVQVSEPVNRNVSCAKRSRFLNLNGCSAEMGYDLVATDATP